MDADEEIYALDPFAPGPPEPQVEASLPDPLHAKLLERLYVGEEMARFVWTLRFDSLETDDLAPSPRNSGAAELLAAVGPRLAAGRAAEKHCWRGAERLDRIALRLLLGRARTRLAASGPEGDAEAGAVLTGTRLALGRDPENG